MDKIAASIVYDILVKAGAEETAKQFRKRVPSSTSPIPYSSRLVQKLSISTNKPKDNTDNSPEPIEYDEDFIVLEAMVKYAMKSRTSASVPGTNTTNTTSLEKPSTSVTSSTTDGVDNSGKDMNDRENNDKTKAVTNTTVVSSIAEPRNTNVTSLSTSVLPSISVPSSYAPSSLTISNSSSASTVSTESLAIVEPWNAEELALFEKALLQFPAGMDKNARFRAIATVVETRSKRECYDKFQELYPATSSSSLSSAAASTITTNIHANSSNDQQSSKSILSNENVNHASSVSSLWEDISSVPTNFTDSKNGNVSLSAKSISTTRNDEPLSTNVIFDENDCEVISMDNISASSSQNSPYPDNGAVSTGTGRSATTKIPTSARTTTTILELDEPNDTVSYFANKSKPNGEVIPNHTSASGVIESNESDTFFHTVKHGKFLPTPATVPYSSGNVPNQSTNDKSVISVGLSSHPPSNISDGLWEGIDKHSSRTQTVPSHSASFPPAISSATNSDLVEEDIEFSSTIVTNPPNTSSTKPVLPSSNTLNTTVSKDAVPHSSSSLSSIPVQTITAETVALLRMALHGQYPLNSSSLPSNTTTTTQLQALRPEWLLQNLQFTEEIGLRYGLLQTKGGPCGPLACINAETVRHLYYSPFASYADSIEQGKSTITQIYDEIIDKFGTNGTLQVIENYSSVPLDPSETFRTFALIFAISDILWRCRPDNVSSVTVAIFDESIPRSSPQVLQLSVPLPDTPVLSNLSLQVSFSSDGVTDRLRLYTCTDQKQIISVLHKYISVFIRPSGPGLSLVLYSAVLTRGITKMLQDMVTSNGGALYGSTSLVGSYGYASQELVNLLLTGRATSYTFNGKQAMDNGKNNTGTDDSSSATTAAAALTLIGIEHRTMVGFLSVLHAVGYMDVGTNLREPYTPVWVVFGESHYSILFAAPLHCTFPPLPKKRYTFGRKMDRSLMNNPDPLRCIGTEAIKDTIRIGYNKTFDIIYWDGLARQDELYRLTVKLPSTEPGTGSIPLTTITQAPVPKESELSAIELWIWSKYPNAKVMWNDIDPWEPLRITADYLPPKYRTVKK